ncbi:MULTISPECIES: copper resistance CopC family protein [unclassified Streptomyces]|uniref:copper resistance CopC family protein n=1 Tax=unclassified Streptomyces TaxID=2593676 RepID=UPI003D737DCD
MRGLRPLRAPAALVALLGALLLLGGPSAYAHSALKDATPGPGAKAAPGTDAVSLTFGPLKSGTTPKIGLTGPDGAAVAVGRPVTAGGSVVCAAVTPLVTGVHTLTYTVTSADGDTSSSAFQFEVAEGAEPAAVPSGCQGLSLSAPAGDDGSGTILGLGRTTALIVLAVAAAAVGGGVLTARAMRRAPSSRRKGAAL